MPKQPESASALAKSESSTLDMLRMMTIIDPNQMVEAMHGREADGYGHTPLRQDIQGQLSLWRQITNNFQL